MPRRNTKNSRGRTDHMELVEEILYRFGGCVAEQVAQAMLMYSTVMQGREYPWGSALEASRRTLRVMRQSGQVEAISIRRPWKGKTEGRHENLYRLVGGKDSLIEGALAAGVDGQQARSGYARPWSGGGIDHTAQRTDVLIRLIEMSYSYSQVEVDLDSVYSETSPHFPLVGAVLPYVDAGGAKIVRKETSSRRYERVVPDAEFTLSIEGGFVCPFYVEMERRINATVISEKIRRYCGYWLRGLERRERCDIQPILFVLSEPRHRALKRKGSGAQAMRDRVRKLLAADADGCYTRLDKSLKARDPDADLGRFLLIADYEAYTVDPYRRVFFPISPYPEVNGDAIWFGVAARERAYAKKAYGQEESA